MRTWLTTRRVLPLVVWLTGLTAVGVLLGPRGVVLPSLVGGRGSSALLSGFLPMFWAAAIADTFAARTSSVEGRPGRRLGQFDVGLFLVVTGVAAVLYDRVVLGATVDGARSLMIASGVAVVVVLRRTPATAVFVVTAAVLGTSVYGVNAPGARFVHLFQEDGDPWTSGVVGIVACGAACWLLLRNRVNTRLRGPDPDQ